MLTAMYVAKCLCCNHVMYYFACALDWIKTKCMLFSRLLPAPDRPTSITTLDGSDLKYVYNYKYLGVWLDCKLSFQTHIKHLQSNSLIYTSDAADE